MASSLGARICAFLLLLATSYCAVAQKEMNSAFVTVVVSDTLGGAIPNARVHVLERSSRNQTEKVTDETGDATLRLQPGKFDLTVKGPTGFQDAIMTDVDVRPGEHRHIKVVLKVWTSCCTIIDFVDPNERIEPESVQFGNLEEPTEKTSTPRNSTNDQRQPPNGFPIYLPSGQTDASVFIAILPHLGEPSLLDAAKDGTVRAFRVSFFSPVPTNEVAVRLTVNPDGSGKINVAVLSGNETLVKRTTNDVSSDDVDRFLTLVNEAKFWTTAATETEPNENATNRKAYVLDGGFWMLEGVQNGSYHYVFRRNPKSTSMTEIGCYLAKHLVKTDSASVPMPACAPTTK